MHVALLDINDIPNNKTGGSSLFLWSLMNELMCNRHRVTVVATVGKNDPYRDRYPFFLQVCKDRGAEVIIIPQEGRGDTELTARTFMSLARKIFWPSIMEMYPEAKLAPAMDHYFARIKPDVIFTHHFQGLAAIHRRQNKIPRMAIVGDPMHLPAWYSWRYKRPASILQSFLYIGKVVYGMLHYPRLMKELLGSCAIQGAVAAHHAAWFRVQGLKRCKFYSEPIEDMGGIHWEARRKVALEARGFGSKPKILMVGHLRGAATLAGIIFFCDRVLPVLDKELGHGGFEVHIVGAFSDTLKPSIRKKLSHPAIRLRGYLSTQELDNEFFSADVFLVPTPVRLGIRARIITAFSYGSCVVAHVANSLGIPQLVHGQNVLLAHDGMRLAQEVIRALRDPLLCEQLGRGGRQTFEAYYEPTVASAIIIKELERLVANRS